MHMLIDIESSGRIYTKNLTMNNFGNWRQKWYSSRDGEEYIGNSVLFCFVI
jgi:hypothetical protein